MHKGAKDFVDDQSGAMAVTVALLLVVLLAVAALAIDFGHMAWVQNELQKAADAGALAGARVLGSPSNPDWATAQYEASRVALLNRADAQNLADCQVNYGYWSKTARSLPLKPPGSIITSSDVPAIQVIVAKSPGHNGGALQMFFAPILGIPTVNLGAQAVAMSKQTGPGPFKYTIFSGSQTLNLNLSAAIFSVKGSVHSNDNLNISAAIINITGSAEAVHNVTIMAAISQVGSTVNNASIIDIPDYSQQIAAIAGTVYSGNQTFNGAINQIDNSIYVQGSVTLNGAIINGTGAILATGDINLNGAGVTINGSNQVCLYSSNGNIIVNAASFSNNTSSAILYAPNGTVTINTAVTNYQGRVIANQVIINGASMNFNGDDYPVTSLPGASGGGQGAALVN
jgi:Flp pilus assembly pilin Flp